MSAILDLFRSVRGLTEALCEPLAVEDQVVQTMPDQSPTKWHLAHTSWFFETFALARFTPGYRSYHPRYHHLFNSYYNAVGEPFARPARGLLSRPTVEDVRAYRHHVDGAMAELLAVEPRLPAELLFIVTLGIHHEEQHQELILTDAKHVLASNPLAPPYREVAPAAASPPPAPHAWHAHPGGIVEIGHDGAGFAFDNEGPRHRVHLEPFEIGSRLVTCGEFAEFIADGGYERPELWLSDGWDARRTLGWQAPLYWRREREGFRVATLSGGGAMEASEPVCHVSYYEADAYARWAHARLPREEEWEIVAAPQSVRGNLLDQRSFHPRPLTEGASDRPQQMFGDVWEWTASPYVAYPGFAPFAGALGEYNGKFMCNQLVLRGGSCATPARHLRATYRNFFPPAARWQFSGIRLARS